MQGGDAVSFRLDGDDLAVDEARTGRARGGAHRAEQRVRVEPAFAGEAERAGSDAFGRKPGKACGEGFGFEERDGCAFGFLDAMVLFEDRAAVRRREDEIAALAERRVGVRTEARRHPAQEIEPEAGEADVLRRGELLADRRGGKRGRGGREARIALDHRDGAGEAFG